MMKGRREKNIKLSVGVHNYRKRDTYRVALPVPKVPIMRISNMMHDHFGWNKLLFCFAVAIVMVLRCPGRLNLEQRSDYKKNGNDSNYISVHSYN